MLLYHGSRVPFKEFKVTPGERRVLFSSFPVTVPGHFFTPHYEDALGYGRHVATVEVSTNKPLVDPAVDKHLGVDRLRNEGGYIDTPRELHLAKLVASTIKRDEHGPYIERNLRHVPIYPYSHPRNDSTHEYGFAYHGLASGGIHWDLLDHPGASEKLARLGYDSTWVHEPESEHGSSLYVPHSHADKIKILGWDRN